jgi:uncharacterized protein (TIRG00374 family)
MSIDVTAVPAVSIRDSSGRKLMIRMALGLGVGASFGLIFLRLINFRAVSERLAHLNVSFALLSGLVFLSAYAVRALRWRSFLAPDKITARRAIGIYFIAIFLNWLLPVQGGELAKSGILRRTNGIPVSRSLATVMMDKAMDLFPAVALLTVVPLAHLQLSNGLWLLLMLPLVLLGVGGLVLALASWRHERTMTLLSRFFGAVLPRHVAERVEPFVVSFFDTLLTLFRKPRVLAIAIAYTAVAVTLDALFCYLAFRSVGTSLSLSVVLYGYTFYNLAYILPTPPAHLGSNELIGLLIFSGMFGASRTAVGAMFLFSHPFTGILMTVTALFCVRAIGLDFRSTLELRSAAEGKGDA